MATIAVGDIHGNLPALNDLLRQLQGEVAARDTIVFLGDYIDRGPDTKGCVDAILEFQQEVSARVVCLRGNHEEWFLRTLHDDRRHSWLLGMEALDTIRSYSAEAAQALRAAMSEAGLSLFGKRCALPYGLFFDTMPETHRVFFKGLVPYHQSEDCVCVHGGLDPQITRLEDQPVDALIWGAIGFPDRYRGTATVAYGHWNNAVVNAEGWPTPKIIGPTIGLDTISHGVLTAVRLPDHKLFQSARHRVSGATKTSDHEYR
jgi:serine/threonine protein phosphatase 1